MLDEIQQIEIKPPWRELVTGKFEYAKFEVVFNKNLL